MFDFIICQFYSPCHLEISSSGCTFSSFGAMYTCFFFHWEDFLITHFTQDPSPLVRAFLSLVLFDFQTDLRFLVTTLQAFGTAGLYSVESSWRPLVNPHGPLSGFFLPGILLSKWNHCGLLALFLSSQVKDIAELHLASPMTGRCSLHSSCVSVGLTMVILHLRDLSYH